MAPMAIQPHQGMALSSISNSACEFVHYNADWRQVEAAATSGALKAALPFSQSRDRHRAREGFRLLRSVLSASEPLVQRPTIGIPRGHEQENDQGKPGERVAVDIKQGLHQRMPVRRHDQQHAQGD